jgi:ATP-dependent exoDNAse (exonuclease V) beta subunit
MTRAEERLVLLGGWPEAPAPRPPEEARSYLDLLGTRFQAVASVRELRDEAAGRRGQVDRRVDRHGVRWVFPELEARGEEGDAAAGEGAERPAAPDPAAVAAAARRLRELRAEAAARGARPVGAPASAEAHRRLEELAEERFEEGGPGGRAAGADLDHGPDRRLALAAGTAVHRVLEELDLAAGAAAELARHRQRLPELLRPLLPEDDLAAAVERCEELLDRLASPGPGGDLLERLAALGEGVVARELPVLLPPGAADGVSGPSPESPVGFVSGSVDLLYRDPESGRLVVADYKTDRVEGAGEIAERARAYAPQARLYAAAVRDALGLDEPPRAELWFLWPGAVQVVEPA